MNPKLSIVTICFNNADGLRETLNSVWNLQHGFRDFEHIVVDGGSQDATCDVLREYADRLVWWCSEPDKGIYNAMNKGAGHACGEYLLFLNSGDVLMEDALKGVFEHEFSEDLVYGDIYTRAGLKSQLIMSPSDSELTPAYLTINTLPHQATLIRRQLHDDLGGYDETLRISAAPKFIIDALLGRHCTHRYLGMAFSVFDRTGISCDMRYLPSKLREWQSFLKPHFGERVADSFFRTKMAEKIVSKGVIEYVSRSPERLIEIRQFLNDGVRDIKHNAYARKISKLTKQVAELKARRDDREKANKALKRELASLKRSFAYRVGMFVTWPARKIYRFVLKHS